MLSRFWLLNGAKKKGKKSSVKIKRHKVARRKKSFAIVPEIVTDYSVRRPSRNIIKDTIELRPFKNTLEREIIDIKPLKRSKKMAKRKVTKKVAKRKVAKKMKKVTGKAHRIVARYHGKTLKTSKRSKLAKRNLTINPKINVKGIINDIKPMAVLGGTAVASMIGLNYGMNKIPFVKTQTGVMKTVSKLGVGIVAYVLVKKFLRMKDISNGVLLGSVISAISDYVNPVTTGSTVAGLKLGNALNYGRPSSITGNPQFKLSGLKVPNTVSGLKLAGAKSGTQNDARW